MANPLNALKRRCFGSRDARYVAFFGLLFLLMASWQNGRVLHAFENSDQAWIGGWDANGYFAWGRSLARDGDVDFRNEFSFAAGLKSLGGTARKYAAYLKNTTPTATGKIPNKYSIGPGLAALPALWASRSACALRERWTGRPISQFPAIDALAYTQSNAFYGLAGLACAWWLLRRRFGRWRALLAVAVVFAGTPLSYYILFDPGMAHAVAFGAATAFFGAMLAWERSLRQALPRFSMGERSREIDHPVMPWLQAPGQARPKPSARRVLAWAFAMGLLLGACALARFNDAVLAIAPMALALRLGIQAIPAARGRWMRLTAGSLVLSTAGALLGFFPQMLGWKSLYGKWLVYSYSGETLHAWPIHLPNILFGSLRGEFVWTPLAAIAAWGLAKAAGRGRPLALASLASLAALSWVYGGWDCYWLGDSFGMRGFVDLSFPLMAGIAWMLTGTTRHRAVGARQMATRRRLLAMAMAACVAWNVFFMSAYLAGAQPHSKPLAPVTCLRQWRKCFRGFYKPLRMWQKRRMPLFTPAPLATQAPFAAPVNAERRTRDSRNMH
jgi:hypothetical protein